MQGSRHKIKKGMKIKLDYEFVKDLFQVIRRCLDSQLMKDFSAALAVCVRLQEQIGWKNRVDKKKV
jgi:hypothetical protein